ncbi:subunit of tubulin prefoldin [Schaereria dolodes]|nr:subunit of tubulin prefoldin [Schaereria dolodes]
MSNPSSAQPQGQTVDLNSLSAQQLSSVKKQLDDELEHLTSSFQKLRAAQGKFRECLKCVGNVGAEENSKGELGILGEVGMELRGREKGKELPERRGEERGRRERVTLVVHRRQVQPNRAMEDFMQGGNKSRPPRQLIPLSSTISTFLDGECGGKDGKQKTTGLGKKILVPLTTSLYVPGTLADTDRVIVDVGTGFYVEKTTKDATEFYKSKIEDLGENLKDLERIVQGKSGNLRVVEDGRFSFPLALLGQIFSVGRF